MDNTRKITLNLERLDFSTLKLGTGVIISTNGFKNQK